MVLSPSYIHTNKAKFTTRLPISYTLYILNTEQYWVPTTRYKYNIMYVAICYIMYVLRQNDYELNDGYVYCLDNYTPPFSIKYSAYRVCG